MLRRAAFAYPPARGGIRPARDGLRTLWAAPSSFFWGCTLWRSDDLEVSWSDRETRSLRFPEDSGLALKRVWQIRAVRASDSDRVFLGVEPSCVFESNDGDES